MLEKAINLLSKAYNIAESRLDDYLVKSKMDSYDSIERQSVDYDPINEYNNSQGWKDKTGPLGFEALKEISYSSSLFTAISLRRINEIAAFCHPQRSKYDIGYVIKKRDESTNVTDEERKEMHELLEFINNTGLEKGRDKITKQSKSFEEFIRLIMDDRLRYNQIAFERVPFKYTKNGEFKLHSFYAVPAFSIRYASSKVESKKALKECIDTTSSDNSDKLKKRIDDFKDDDLYYVQVKDGRVIRVFDANELALIQGNLNSDLDNNGYCRGEFELAFNLITTHIFAETHNKLYFTQGFSNKGILVIKNKIGRKDMQRFKQHFRQQMQGTSNAFRVPIISNTDIQWVSFQSDSKDMEWKEWAYYLIKLICACFQMSPQEINFDISRDSSSLNEGNRQKEVFNMFKETGVRPLLRWVQNFVNREIIKYYNAEYYKKYVFHFVGIDTEQQRDEIDRLIKEMQNYKTINEARKELGLKSLKNGDIILSGIYMQFLGLKQQQDAQRQMMGDSSNDLELSFDDEDDKNDDNIDDIDSEYKIDNKENEDINDKNSKINSILSNVDTNKASNDLDDVLHKSQKINKIKVEWYKKDK